MLIDYVSTEIELREVRYARNGRQEPRANISHRKRHYPYPGLALKSVYS
jgi:hypothetical protein